MTPHSIDLYRQVALIGGFIALLWILEAIDQLILRGWLNRFGIIPRSQIGLRGILFAPLLHGTWGHLAANTIPLLVLAGLTISRSQVEFAIVTAVVWLGSGLGVWLLAGSRTLHLGASGLVFGYLGFLLSRSYFERDALSAALSLVVVFLYGPLLWGILPGRRGISWQGHLFGFISGVLAARYLPELKHWLGGW